MNVFLITRPIQYVNVLNLPFDIVNSVLIIQNSFSTINTIYEIAQKDKKRWKKVIICTTNNSIFRWLFKNRKHITSLTTYTDFGIRWYLLFSMMKKRTEINIYEEGLATYSCWQLKGIKRILYSILNRQNMSILYLGASRYIHGIYVYDVLLHNQLMPQASSKVLKFKSSLEILVQKESLFNMLYKSNSKFQGKKIFLYLTNWEYNENVSQYIPDDTYLKIIKPHPKLEINSSILKKFDIVIGPEYLAEIVVATLLNEAKYMIVIHEGSTSMLHFIPNEKLKEICLESETSIAYKKVKEKIITLYS